MVAPKSGGPNDRFAFDAQTSMLKEKKFSGSGSDTDIITSSARAYVSAINKLLSWHKRRMTNGADDHSGIADAVAVQGEEPIVVN